MEIMKRTGSPGLRHLAVTGRSSLDSIEPMLWRCPNPATPRAGAVGFATNSVQRINATCLASLAFIFDILKINRPTRHLRLRHLWKGSHSGYLESLQTCIQRCRFRHHRFLQWKIRRECRRLMRRNHCDQNVHRCRCLVIPGRARAALR